MIVQTTLPHLVAICHDLDPEQREEYAAMSWSGEYDPDETATRLYTTMGVGCTLLADGVPMAAGGCTWSRPGVAATWMVGVPHLRPVIKELTQIGRQIIDAAFELDTIQRVETWAAATHTKAHRWYRLLGLKKEADLRQYAGGKDFVVFVRLKEDAPCA